MRIEPTADSRQPIASRGFTLVEMLIAMAITLVMMAAVVTLFANVSGSIRNRRATVEMTNQLRHVRNVLQQDLQGATCPGLTWQRPESNHGYIELIEGLQSDQNPTPLVRDLDGDGLLEPNESQIDPGLSALPRNNLRLDANGDGRITVQEREAHHQSVGSLVPGGLGDFDDILMLTVRNEHEPFVGRMPANVRPDSRTAAAFDVEDRSPAWSAQTIESPLAEVVWFALENPDESNDANNFFGEPGMRTIYRRTLLIAPWVNPYRYVDPRNGAVVDTFRYDGGEFKAEPGLVRMLPQNIGVEQAIAAVIAFQDRYDLSVRLEWDHDIRRWKIMANTLADLTKRENRFGHYGFMLARRGEASAMRVFPYPLVSLGSGYPGSSADVKFAPDPEVRGAMQPAQATANVQSQPMLPGFVTSYRGQPANYDDALGGSSRRYPARPFPYVDETPAGVPATAGAMLNDKGQVVRVVHGPVPLWGARRGEDVMMTGALAFDVRVYDPGAPLYRENTTSTVLEPSDPGWKTAYHAELGKAQAGATFLGQGAFVDLGYVVSSGVLLPSVPPGASWLVPWFADARALSDVYLESRPANERWFSQLATGYAVYDTWSFHYENNGVNEDQARFDGNAWQPVDASMDEGTNGIEDPGNYADAYQATRLGVDDMGERETAPPYDRPLRGVQVLLRVYEPDSRAIRQVRVIQHFMPE
jgi:prepilin-type N-terminal cleavage/methylation domain-containing protein